MPTLDILFLWLHGPSGREVLSYALRFAAETGRDVRGRTVSPSTDRRLLLGFKSYTDGFSYAPIY